MYSRYLILFACFACLTFSLPSQALSISESSTWGGITVDSSATEVGGAWLYEYLITNNSGKTIGLAPELFSFIVRYYDPLADPHIPICLIYSDELLLESGHQAKVSNRLPNDPLSMTSEWGMWGVTFTDGTQIEPGEALRAVAPTPDIDWTVTLCPKQRGIVPEPSSLWFVCVGLAGVFGYRWKMVTEKGNRR